MKSKIMILILMFLMLGFSAVTRATYWGSPDLTEKWVPVLIDSTGITVTYEVKYGGTYTVDCVGLWENKCVYLLTFRDGDGKVLQKDNVVSIYYGVKK
jgi:hypothetical protein